MEECEQAFQQLKEHLGKLPLLSKPAAGEVLSLYLVVSKHAVSSVLIREEKKVQLPVYYISKRLLDAEMRYPQMQVLQKPDTSGRLLKWSIELSQFDINYKPRTAIKGQALADFVVEFAGLPDGAEEGNAPQRWKLYVDGSSNEYGSGAGLVLHTPEGHKITLAIRFEFPVSNNEAEYEALLAGLRLAEHLKVGNIDIFSDLQLVVNQVKGQYQTRDEKMVTYLKKVKEALEKFTAYDIQQGYYWPNLKKDAAEYAKRCESCQRYTPTPRLHSEDLTSIVSPWPFAKWGIDLIGPLHKTLGGYKFAIVAIDYFTKWVEAEPLTTISEEKCTNFIWNNIVCRFGVPHSLVSDNGRQFNNDNTNQFCELLGIHKNFSSVIYP
ncbi:uncharacterized protein LOC112091692 [Morus notabilis]|uniref:uncharacterized protein LOC112091692 n=1 Tax=Morus notabilis TaxID=981085 RepID=UPI000CED57EA|nr:uncharacterized protein LOC112091692 [Morus notabilis]